MQAVSITYDTELPAPYVMLELDGYVQIQANPAMRARFPLWLLEIMQNDILARIPTIPHSGLPALPVNHTADVIDFTAARRSRAV